MYQDLPIGNSPSLLFLKACKDNQPKGFFGINNKKSHLRISIENDFLVLEINSS
ncbi:hypothetical protein AsAng_0026340 [Aureispira anguillae]|uniref:Uncharacterized protein n=1 Tax=Aureispira anguillae TaxID=2864201 RepID=A0A916DTK5_9BACT|nr:hypothetical protein AsAng_0026340 [Aureispira anguillae]